MDVPARWRSYPCDDYFRDGWCDHGHFDEYSQLSIIVPLSKAYENAEIEFFAIGRSGCDGIDFGYRKNHAGLWAFYPIEREFSYVAATVPELVDDYCSGRLKV